MHNLQHKCFAHGKNAWQSLVKAEVKAAGESRCSAGCLKFPYLFPKLLLLF